MSIRTLFLGKTNLWLNFKFRGHCIRFASLIFIFSMIIREPSVCNRHALVKKKNSWIFISDLSCCDWPIKNTITIKIHKIFHRFKQSTLIPDSRVYIWSIWSDIIRWEYLVLNHVILSYLKLRRGSVFSYCYLYN